MDGRKIRRKQGLAVEWGKGHSRDPKEGTRGDKCSQKASSVLAGSHQRALGQLHKQDREMRLSNLRCILCGYKIRKVIPIYYHTWGSNVEMTLTVSSKSFVKIVNCHSFLSEVHVCRKSLLICSIWKYPGSDVWGLIFLVASLSAVSGTWQVSDLQNIL